MSGLSRLLAVVVALLMVAAPAVAVALPRSRLGSAIGPTSLGAEVASARSGGSDFLALQDETLLVPLFNKTGMYYLVVPIFRVENSTM